MPIRFLDEEPSATQAFRQGLLVEGPSNMAALADFAIQSVSPAARIRERAGLPQAGPTLEERTRGSMTGFTERAFGESVQPPGTAGGRLLQAAGAGVTETIPFLPLVGLGGGGIAGAGRRGALDLLAGVSGETSRQGAEEFGLGPVGQTATSLVGALAPAGVASRARQLLPVVRNRAARQVARDVLGREIPDRAEAMRLLQQEIDAPLFGRATTDQVLQDMAPGTAGIMKRLARDSFAGADLRREAFELRRLSARAAEEFGASGFGAGPPGAASAMYLDRLRRIKSKVERAYRGVGDLEGIPTHKLKAASAFVRQDAGDELESLLPKRSLRLIEGYGETTNLKNLQRLRRQTGAEARKAMREGNSERAFFLNKIVDSIEETFDEVAEIGGATEINALRRARTIRAIQAERFDPKDPLNRVLGGEFEDMGKAFNRFLNTERRPVESLNRLRMTLGGNPDAWGGVQRLMRDRVFGEDFDLLTDIGNETLSRSGAGKALKNLQKLSREFDAVYGTGASENAEQFIRRAHKLSRGVVGKPEEFAVTGSNVAPSSQMNEQAEILADMARGSTLWWRDVAVKAFRLVTGNNPRTLREADALLAQAMVDPKMAKAFLQELSPQQLERWQRRARAFLENPVRTASGVFSVEGSEERR